MSQNKNRLPNYEKKQSWANYDPVDASRTAANVEVAFLKRLFTFKLRTRNAFSLITMLLFGIALTGFMSFAIYAAITTFVHSHGAQVGPYLFLAFFYSLLSFVWLIGLALLINFVVNVWISLGFVRSTSGSNNGKEHNRKEAKKKLPKRRKDFR